MRDVIRIFNSCILILLCAQAAEAQCTFDISAPIPDTTTITLQIEVDSLVNNDLGNGQSLCAVELKFRHSYIGDLTIDLVSPSGQSVQLVGPVTDLITPTNLTTWDVRFVQCGFPASPDPGFTAQWDNNQDWQILASYSGSYYPANGCLEDFNTGSANGIWQLVVTDHDAPQTGLLMSVTLIFCDNTGLECAFCGADAGLFQNPVRSVCASDQSQIAPFYPDTIPDPSLYGYYYLVSSDQIMWTPSDQVSPASLGPGSYTICGLSYSYADSSELFALLHMLSLGDLQDSFANGHLNSCADLTLPCLTLTISPEIDTTFIDTSICSGTSVTVGGKIFTMPGHYVVNVDVPDACDSTIVLDLQVIQVHAAIVQGDTISCAHPMTTLDGSGSVAGPSAIYHWTTANGMIIGPPDQPVITISGAGTYTLHINDQGCTDSLSYTAIGDNSIPFVSVKGGVITCKDPVFTFKTIVFPTDVAVQWNGPGGFMSTQLSPSVSVPGIYLIRVTEPGGCSASASVNVLIDTATVKPAIVSAIDCPNQRTHLSGTPGNLDYTYGWTGPGGFTFNSRQFYATVPGTYCATLTPPNGCPATTCIDVQSDYSIPDIQITASSDTIHCSSQVDLSAMSDTLGVSYSWTGPAGVFSSSAMVSVLTSGTYIASALAPNGCMNSDTVLIVDGPDVFAASVFGDTLTCTIDTGLIGAVTFEPGATYAWSGPGLVDTFSAFVRVVKPGIYQVSVTVGTCTRILQVRVDQDYTRPNFTPFTDTISCSMPVAELSMLITSPYSSILWQLPDGSTSSDSVLFTTLPGTYLLTLDRSNGCALTKTVTVRADTTHPQLFLGSDILGCDSVQIAVVSTDAIQTYQWSGPGGFASQVAEPFVHEGGYYILTVAGINGCSAAATYFVDTNRTPPMLILQTEALDCVDSVATLIQSSPDSAVAFAWYTGGLLVADSSRIDVTSPGVYVAQATGANGCVRTDTVTIEPPLLPSISVTTDTITCVHDATLHAASDSAGVSFSWMDAGGHAGSGNMFSTASPGSVLLTALGANGCNTDTVVLVAADTVPPVAIANTNEMVLCDVQTISLDGSISSGRGLSYLWTTPDGMINSGATTATPTITGEGTYILQVTDSVNGCMDSDTLKIIEGQSMLGRIFLTTISECEGNSGGSITIDSVPGAATGLTYALNGEAGGPVFSGLTSGAYLIAVADSFGCTTDTLVDITNTSSVSTVNLGADQEIIIGDSTVLTATIDLDPSQLLSVHWVQPVLCDSCLSNVVAPLQTTQYEVEIEDIFGCTASDAVTVYVDQRSKFYLPNVFSPNGDGINDVLMLKTHPGVARVVRWMIYDRWGDAVFGARDFDANSGDTGWDGTANGRELNPGVFVYMLELKLLTGRTEIFTGTVTLIK